MTLRNYQLSLLTAGRTLPLPALSKEILDVVAEAVGRVWSELMSELPPTTVLAMLERQLSTSMEAKLNNLRDIDKIWKTICGGVVRGRETVEANGIGDELRADLSFSLNDRNANHPLVAECKIIERRTNRTTAMYRDEGVERFVDGRYSWWSQEALMIAYVRDGSRIDVEIPMLFPKNAEQCHLAGGIPSFRTSHSRNFPNPGARPENGEPGEIAIYHLWFAT